MVLCSLEVRYVSKVVGTFCGFGEKDPSAVNTPLQKLGVLRALARARARSARAQEQSVVLYRIELRIGAWG